MLVKILTFRLALTIGNFLLRSHSRRTLFRIVARSETGRPFNVEAKVPTRFKSRESLRPAVVATLPRAVTQVQYQLLHNDKDFSSEWAVYSRLSPCEEDVPVGGSTTATTAQTPSLPESGLVPRLIAGIAYYFNWQTLSFLGAAGLVVLVVVAFVGYRRRKFLERLRAHPKVRLSLLLSHLLTLI